MEPQIITTEGGSIRLFVDPSENRQAKAAQKALSAGVTGKRTTFKPLPGTPSTTYTDPSKARKIEDVRAECFKVYTKDLGNTKFPDRLKAQIGRVIVAGYAIQFTQGNFAYCAQLTMATDAKPMYSDVTWIGTVPREAWRDLTPVREFANERSGAIYWTVGQNRVTWYASTPDLGEARAWTPTMTHETTAEPGHVILADQYAWMLRGRSWQFGITTAKAFQIALFLDLESSALIVIAGMKA